MSDKAISKDYEVLEELGRGSFGVVYRGIEKSSGEIVAIKLINLEEAEDDIQEIQQEISVLSTCASPFVTQYKASFLQGHKLWIVMEYLGGGSCLDLLKPGVFPEQHIAIICRELLLGLQYLHAEGKIHRDIKAANILLAESGKVKLADFGVAAQLTNIKSHRNTFVGTPFWMAPEVIQQEGYSFMADIWSLAITALELAMGAPPLADIHPMKVLFLIPKNPPPKLKGHFSKSFKDFIARCLVKDPDHRLSAKDLLSHRFIKSAGKVEMLQELVRRKQTFDWNKTRKSHPVYYQETLKVLTPAVETEEWTFDTVKSMAPPPPRKPSLVRSRNSSPTFPQEAMRALSLSEGPLQMGSPAPATVKRIPSRRPFAEAQQMRRASALREANSASRGGSVVRRPLQPDMSFGNSGSTTRIFQRVPSDGSIGADDAFTSRFDDIENQPPSRPVSMVMDLPPASKEATLGHRLYTKALEPTLAELHAQTSLMQKREALAKLSEALDVLDSVDPEGFYHLAKGLLAHVGIDKKLSHAFLPGSRSSSSEHKIVASEDTPQGTVLISRTNTPQTSPQKLLISAANPHLKSHRRRQSAIVSSADISPSKASAAAAEEKNFLQRRDREREALEAKMPGRPAEPGMEHTKQLEQLLYGRWAAELQGRWPRAAMTGDESRVSSRYGS